MGRLVEQNPGKTLLQLQPELRQAWNRVDARLGQVNYNRLFINNVAKNAIQALVRSPGWSGGTLAEIGGSLKDTGTFLREWQKTGSLPAEIPDRVAYTLSLFTTMAALNALLTYALSGKKPEGVDYWAFRTGAKDEQGRPERMLLPSYMKDVFSYYEDPKQTLLNKSAPLLSLMSDIYHNRDYYGVKVYNEDDNIAKRQIDKGIYALKAFEPFWMRGMGKEAERGGGLVETISTSPQKIIAPEFGIMPASSAFTLSDAEKLANKISISTITLGSRTAEKKQRDDLITKYSIFVRKAREENMPVPDSVRTSMRSDIASGKLSQLDIAKIMDRAFQDPLLNHIKNFSLNDALKVFEVATPAEKKKMRERLINKAINLSRRDPAEFTKVREKFRDAVKGNP